MEQATFSELDHDSKQRRTRREVFLEKMDRLIPRERLEKRIGDPGMEDLLYEVESVRRFAGLRLAGPLPEETTILKFRHLLGARPRRGAFRGDQRAPLVAGVRKGTIVDPSIVDAPSSTKNAEGGRDPEMHQTKKGNRWHFGMKAHIGVDAETGLAHSLATTAANVSDVATADAVPATVRGDPNPVLSDLP